MKPSVADQMLDGIVNRGLCPGERILENEVAKSLGMARTTLREVRQYLENHAVMTKAENRGTYVTRLATQDVRDIYDVRMMFEPEAEGLPIGV